MIKNSIILLLWILLIASCSNPEASTEMVGDLVWSDEFNNDEAPDTTKWAYDIGGGGWGNNELQYYTSRLENARIENGILVIEARREAYENNEYTSARMVTKNKGDWLYGRVEVKARIPDGVGTWPAIWMLPTVEGGFSWPLDGEIDIMEHVGFDQGVVHGTIHTEAFNHKKGTQKAGQITLDDVSEAFHVYSIDWNADSITWYVDGKKYHTFMNENMGKEEWPFDKPFHLLLNIAVGGFWGGQEGVDEDIWPKRMEIDWVRVYANP